MLVRTIFLALSLFAPLFFFQGEVQAAPAEQAVSRVTVVVDSELSAAAGHGLQRLRSALEAKGVKVQQRKALNQARGQHVLVLGRSSGSAAVRQLAETAGLTLPAEPEALLLHNLQHNGNKVLLICGADDRGLMYGALEVSEHVRLSRADSDPLAGIANAQEKPASKVRSITRMLMNRAVVEKYFDSEEFWDRYLSMLAKDRYNTFTLMFGYGSAGYFDPPYPFMFDVPEFPEVRVTGITKEEQQRNLKMLQKIIDMSHERGLDFVLALWTHIFEPGYNNFVSAEPRLGFSTGPTRENLIPYTNAALREFLKRFPGIDGIQFRVHTESSVTLPQQNHFWTEVLKVVGEVRPGMLVDMRAKGFTDDLIEAALDSPIKMRMTTKHWGEEMGLPFHPTQDSLANKYKRRHSYADLLSYPRRYDMLWRLWAHGTTKFMLWGSPEFARRFAQSTRLYNGVGFDLYEPLAMKMGYKLGLHEDPAYDLLSKDHQYYDWEFERYWHYYQSFGRMGYNLDTSPGIFKAEFENRFGEQAGSFVEKAYASASGILPRIVAYATDDLSAGHTWPEKQRWEDLPEYIHVRPSDTAQFLGIEEAARFHLAGGSSPKISPNKNSRWFADTSEEVLRLAAQAEKNIGDAKNKEFISTMIDMKVLAYLAAYHSRRLNAGTSFALFEQSADLNALDDAIAHESDAIETWKKIVEITDGVYPDNIIMGRAPRMSGSWKTELEALEKGLRELEQRRKKFRPVDRKVVARLDFGEGPVEPGFDGVTSKTRYLLGKGGYGWHDLQQLPPPSLSDASMDHERHRDFIQGPEADRYTYSAFGIDLPDGDYEVLFEMVDRSAEPKDHGLMWIVAEGKDSTGQFRVPAGELVSKKLNTAVVDGRLNVVFNSTTDGDWLINSMVVAHAGPVIGHVPVRKVSGEDDVVIRATVAGPDPIESIHLTYGGKKRGYKRLPLRPAGSLTYQAVIPRSEIGDGVAYFVEAADRSGRRVFYPRDGAEEPIRIAVTDDDQPPAVVHLEQDLEMVGVKRMRLHAQVTDPSGVESVHVRYRGINQHQDFQRLRLLPTGQGDSYQAVIPANHLDPRWDFMYYLEVADKYGNSAIYPDLNKQTPYVIVNLHEQEKVASDGQ